MTGMLEVDAPPDDVVDRLAVALEEAGQPYVDLPNLLALWDGADPGWVGTTAGRLRLADALHRLDTAGIIELPSRRGTRWDPALPPLPTRLAVPSNRRTRSRGFDAADEPWVPALEWAAAWIRSARPPQRLRLTLATVNRWLASTTGRTPATICREERSLEIFGDEKALASLAGTALFEPRRLTLDLLACEAPLGGLRIARLTDDGPVLVVENKAAFDSAWRGLRGDTLAGRVPGYAAVVFGGGDEAASLVRDLSFLEALLGVQPTRLDYAGDVDIAGVSAAAAFIDAAHAVGLPARPSSSLWRAVAAAEPTGEDLTGDERERHAARHAARRHEFPAGVVERLQEGVRVPQERLDRTALADTSWWASDPPDE